MIGLAGAERSQQALKIADGKKSYTTISIFYITLDLSKEDYREYYNGFTNRVLWPILHYRVDLAEFSRRDLSGYLRVNDSLRTRAARGSRAR